jgi:hypothetical protein
MVNVLAFNILLRFKISVKPLFSVAAVLALAVPLRADPQTPEAANPPPAWFTDKVADTPHFYQLDPRWQLSVAGEKYCAPAAASDALVYLANHGFDRLLPDPTDQDLAQIDIIRKLASDNYMGTDVAGDLGTTPSGALIGLQRFVQDSGYKCQVLQYAGWPRLRQSQHDMRVGFVPDLDWIKSGIAASKGMVLLEIGYYVHGDGQGQWKRLAGHFVAAVGYGTDGGRVDPHLFLVDNPAVGKKVVVGRSANGWITRELTLADQAITLTPSGPIQVIPTDGARVFKPHDLKQSYRVTGPGVPFSTKKYDAEFLDGAIVMILGN